MLINYYRYFKPSGRFFSIEFSNVSYGNKTFMNFQLKNGLKMFEMLINFVKIWTYNPIYASLIFYKIH